MYTNATERELKQALELVNAKYEGNISFNDLRPINSKRNLFTLKAIAGKKGSRTAASGRKGPWASWHVHGEFFDYLFSINSEIYVLSGGKRITKRSGNWEDRNIGSMMNPVYFSEVSIN